MIRTLIDLLYFFNSLSGFLVALIFWTVVTVSFAKSIKKYARIIYVVLGILGLMTFLPVLSLWGITWMKVLFYPVISDIFIEYSHATYVIHPILVIIMYMGAFRPSIPAIAKLMNIRKELSIMVGFAVIPHAINRIIMVVPSAYQFFADRSTLEQQHEIVSVWGQGVMNAVFLLGILMTLLFIVLWVTSFTGIRRKMGFKKWKAVQRWSYVLYAMLFIHAVGIDTGMLITHIESQRMTQTVAQSLQSSNPHIQKMVDDATSKKKKTSFLGMTIKENNPADNGGKRGFGSKFKFSNVEFSTECSCIANIFILVVIYGSYLFFRLRKAFRDRTKKSRLYSNNEKQHIANQL